MYKPNGPEYEHSILRHSGTSTAHAMSTPPTARDAHTTCLQQQVRDAHYALAKNEAAGNNDEPDVLRMRAGPPAIRVLDDSSYEAGEGERWRVQEADGERDAGG